MKRDQNGRVFVITGASSGIGAATAVAAGGAGMKLVLAARRAEQLERIADKVRSTGAEALVVPTDVADEAQVQALMDEAVERFGRIDALFANAGFGAFRSVMEKDDALERKMWDVNYFGTLHCVRAAAAVMKQQRSGHIIICSSIVGRIGMPYYCHYNATKAAQHGLHSALLLELEPYGIDVSCVYPSATTSEFAQNVAVLDGRDAIVENTPRWLVQSADDVAGKIIACLRRPRPEVWPNRISRLGMILWTISPRLARWSLRPYARKYAEQVELADENGESA